ncbi:MAG: hypothetical protein GYB68_01160, partial [Chloroflexi bacterium]|nr:hypothetical protein [Chloroflexota bacterium]
GNIVRVWDDAWSAYQAYRKIEPPDTPEGFEAFMEFKAQHATLTAGLIAFGHLLKANKSVALRGSSLTLAFLNLVSRFPPALENFLIKFWQPFPALNEVIRGDEVYSNVGVVAPGSSLQRFITAKDDGQGKVLAWGVMTDDQKRLRASLRDFRPHVKPLVEAGRQDLAHKMAKDYVDTYFASLVGLVAQLSAMMTAEPPKLNAPPVDM